jgi:hypothetical protein
MGKKNPYSSQNATDIGAQQMAAQNKELGAVDTTAAGIQGTAKTTAGAVNPFYESMYSPTGTGLDAWTRGQLQARTRAANTGFNNALANSRMRGRLAGFGYNQPAERAGESNLENARAQTLSAIPGQVEEAAVPIRMGAAAGRLASGAQEAGAEEGAGGLQLGAAKTYQPATYYGQAANIEEQEANRRAALWGGLMKTVGGVANTFLKP